MNEVSDNSSTTQSLLDKTEKRPLESKKMLAAIFGGGCVMTVWLGTLVCMFVKTDIASHLVSLATIVVSFAGAITTALITGQSAMEWKSMTTIAQVDTNDKEEKKIEQTNNTNIHQESYTGQIVEEGDKNAPELKPFGQTAIK